MAEIVVAPRAPAPAGRWGAAPPQELVERLKDYGQEGAFALWDELAPEERDFLVRDIEVEIPCSCCCCCCFSSRFDVFFFRVLDSVAQLRLLRKDSVLSGH
jgi:hypothetical protein